MIGVGSLFGRGGGGRNAADRLKMIRGGEHGLIGGLYIMCCMTCDGMRHTSNARTVVRLLRSPEVVLKEDQLADVRDAPFYSLARHTLLTFLDV